VQSITHITSSKELNKVFDTTSGLIVDVRNENDFDKNHVSGAINVNLMSPSFADVFTNLDKSRQLFVYCTDGTRSKVAVRILREMGFHHLYLLTEGILEWDGNLLH
jgi:rhodanese-related sulfurtransferase